MGVKLFGAYLRGFEAAQDFRRNFMRVKNGKSGGRDLYSFKAASIDGAERALSDYRGMVLLIVNTASLCGYTPQYEGLEKLHAAYKDRGLRVLAFPSDDFGHQEPGSDAEIKEFCSSRYGMSFELFSKIHVKGDKIHPLYAYLTKESPKNGVIPWNFTKFIADRSGLIAARFGPATDPLDGELRAKIEELLG